MSKNIKLTNDGIKKDGLGMKKDSPVQVKPTVVPSPTTPKK